jgi:hypothetical protein
MRRASAAKNRRTSGRAAGMRVSRYLPLGFPTGVDLFAYNEGELAALEHRSPG